MNRINISLMSLAALALLPIPLAATDGRIPISSAPFTIATPGVYYLTQDLTVASGNAININSDNVTIDLNGRRISSAATTGYGVSSFNRSNIEVGNGTITGFSYAVLLNCNIGTVSRIRVHDLRISGAASYGIAVYGVSGGLVREAVIERNRVKDTTGIGIYLSTASRSRVENNQVNDSTTGASSTGICISTPFIADSIIRGNVVSNCSVGGMYCSSCTATRIEGNHASASPIGINIYNTSSNDTILDNSASACSGTGIAVTGVGMGVEGNSAKGNGTAISLSGATNSFYANNHTINNTTNGVSNAGGAGNVNGGGNF